MVDGFMAFDQAAIKVEREQEFSELRAAIDRVFTAPEVGTFLRSLRKRGLGVREFDAVLALGLIDKTDAQRAGAPLTARQLYESLSPSDQGLIREFYLERLEAVDASWRAKFAQVYRVL
jgi:hypothetical protein